MKTFFTYFILFLIYSFVGWAIEVVVTFNKDKKFVNRGFLLGPYCPIYGFSSIIMILYLSRYRNSFVTVFLLAVVVCSIMEYLVSYIMENAVLVLRRRIDGGIIVIGNLILMEECV